MRLKSIVLILTFFVFSCNEKKEDFEDFDFYGKVISLPAYLTIDNEKTESSRCKSNLHLKSENSNIFFDLRLCSYSYSKRESFEKLSSFFEEELFNLEEEQINLEWIDKAMLNKDGYHEFMYKYKINSTFYYAIHFTYKKHFLIVRIHSDDSNKVKKLSESINFLRNGDYLDNIEISKSERENYCLDCKFPTFW